MNGCSPHGKCRDERIVTSVCLALKPTQCSKIRAVKTVVSVAASCTTTVTYEALDPAYNPLIGYGVGDEVACGNGENLPFDCPGSGSSGTPALTRSAVVSCTPDNEQVLSVYNTAVTPPALVSRTLVATGAAYAGSVIDCNASNITHVVGCAPNGDRVVSRYSTQFSTLVLLNQFNLETGAPYSGPVDNCAGGPSPTVDSYINTYPSSWTTTSQDVSPLVLQPGAHVLVVNGVEYHNPDVSFTVAGNVLSWIWNGSFPLEATDSIVLHAHVSN